MQESIDLVERKVNSMRDFIFPVLGFSGKDSCDSLAALVTLSFPHCRRYEQLETTSSRFQTSSGYVLSLWRVYMFFLFTVSNLKTIWLQTLLCRFSSDEASHQFYNALLKTCGPECASENCKQ